MRISYLRLILLTGLIVEALAPWHAALEAQRLPPETRVRVTTTRDGETTRFVGAVVAMERDTLKVYDRELDRHRLFPLMSIVSVERSEGVRSHSLGERALTVVGSGAAGALIGLASWFSCHEPEDDTQGYDLMSCLIAPGRLDTAVRFGAWAGTGLGLGAALFRGRSERWTRVPIASNGLLFLAPSPSGARLGVTFAF